MLFEKVIDWEPELEIEITLEPSDEPTEEGNFRFITDNGRFYWKKSLNFVGFVVTPYGALNNMVMVLEPDPPHPLLLAFLQKVAIAYKMAKRQGIRSGRDAPGEVKIQLDFIN